VEQWQKTGLTAREFGAQQGLTVSSLYLWRTQLKAAEAHGTGAGDHNAGFSELRLSTLEPEQGRIEIVARNGLVVRVHGDVSARALQQVLAAVEQC
jgi:hypothetical protein